MPVVVYLLAHFGRSQTLLMLRIQAFVYEVAHFQRNVKHMSYIMHMVHIQEPWTLCQLLMPVFAYVAAHSPRSQTLHMLRIRAFVYE
eukprot:4829575-Alexandrium_andersonii.AAC.1